MAIGQSDGSIILSTKVDTKGIKQGTNSIMAMATKAGAALAAAFSVKKIAEFVKASVDAFAEYEQLVGGVETLFKKSADKVMKYANEAYKTAGMSANEYMANVTSFSASLLSSLGGDTDKAAEVANAALISISDNANKMGTDMGSVTMAFQGFAKQQYMLLDNLKLGYGGTKTEMERLLKDAQAITGVEYNIDNLADVYTAIGVIQEKLGIAGTTAKEAATTISGAAGMMRASWQNVLVAISSGGDMDAAIQNFADSVDIYFDNILPVVEKAIFGIGILIEKIAPKLAETVGKAFIAEIPRLVTSIYAMIVGAFKGLYQGIVALFKKETNAMLEEQAEKTEETAESQEKVTDNIKETNKELKKTLAGFDDIQILSAQTAENTQPTELDNITTMGGSDTTLDGSPYAEEVDETLNTIMEIVYPCLIAVGIILLFTGNVGWGIGLIIAGAITAGVTIANTKEEDMSGAVQMLTAIMGVVGGVLLALGIILLWIGGVVGKGVAIGMIIAGGALIVSAVAAQAALKPEDIKSWLSIILGIAGGALLALGIILCMVGSVPLGVGMIIAGAVSLVSAVALNFDFIVEAIKGPIGAIMALVGGALLVIGIILVCTGVLPLGIALIAVGAVSLAAPIALNFNGIVENIRNFLFENPMLVSLISGGLLVIGIILCVAGVLPLGIGLIAIGAVGLAAEAALHWDAIITNIKNFLFENSALIALISGGLLILGIILCTTGVALPLGIALIAAGAAGLVIVTALNWDSIVDWVKGAWDAVKGFWNKYIAPIFTIKWWKDLAIKCGNGLIAGFEGAINGIISAFESMINWIVDGLNKISFDLPEWMGGAHFGIDIPRATFGRVSIPRLAQGAVIPPNREFLAVLGDQKQGTNIEAPLQTIVDAFNIALQGNANYVSGNTKVVLEIDGREFGRAVVEQGNRESRRVGTRLVIN